MKRDAVTRRRRPGDRGPDDPASVPAAAVPTSLRLHRRGRAPGLVRLAPCEPYTIGRGANVELRFDDDAVSRVHAHLKHEDGAWTLVDARSANGTFIVAGGAVPAGGAAAAVDDGHGSAAHDARTATFARARRLLPGAPTTLSIGDVVFFGDAHAALQAIDAPPLRATVDDDDAADDRGVSTRGARYRRELARAARARGPVLLIGASGSGKTWAAQRVHDASGRAGRFVALNAAALPHDPTQLRSVLLGHTRGAFTGATHDVVGAWHAARDGTLFLDEVDSLGQAAQAFLLTLLEQSGDLAPLGAAGTTQAPIDVRVVAAAKVSLAAAGLRRDLSFRLADGAIVEIPSLSERSEDVPGLVRALLDDLRREDGTAAPFADDAVAACVAAPWPGELRQLRGVVRLLSREALDEGRAAVRGADVAARLAVLARALGEAATSTTAPSTSTTLPAPTTPAPATSAPATSTSTPAKSTTSRNPRALTKDDVETALRAASGNIEHAAARLGIARGTLVTKMDRFEIARARKP